MVPSMLVDRYVAELERAPRAAAQPAWLTQTRHGALARFRSLGFPTTREEEWRFTSVAPIAEGSFALPAAGLASLGAADLAPFQLTDIGCAEVVFVNGRYVPELSNPGSLPRGVRVESLAASLSTHDDQVEPYLARFAPFDRQSFTALNTACLADGAFVSVPAGTIVERPIHLLFVSATEGQATMTHPRVLVVMGDHSQATIVESYVGPYGYKYFTNAVTEVVLRQSAVLDHYKIQRESDLSDHIATMQVHAERSANFSSHSVSFGGALVRNDVICVLDGEGVECALNGLYLGSGRRLVDNHTTIDHAKPHCDSREVYKGILTGHARSVFNGKIVVRPDAQKTDAKQTNKALLLSEDAQINTKPQLEIFANDVKCTHGAAVGQMDDEAIFYLRARGLGAREARNLLIHAFASDVLNRMHFEPLRARIDAELLRQLPQAA